MARAPLLLSRSCAPEGTNHHRVALPKIIAVWEKASKVRPHISITKMGYKENSSDFAMGRRPELKSEEFSLYPILVIEIFTILCLKPLKKCYTVWGHDPAGQRAAVLLLAC